MTHDKSAFTTLAMLAFLTGLAGQSFAQTSTSATAGPNLGATPAQPPIFVEFIPPDGATSGMWMLQVDLIVDPSGGPMSKHFQAPMDATGAPIQLDAEQPFPHPLWEDFLNVPQSSVPSVPITDWHEEIHTPGWEWVLPGDSRFPELFPPNESLITRDGQPWDWSHIPMEIQDPSKLWVTFPPIPPGSTLDVHKALLWVGVEGNRTWGDGVDDAGGTVDESFIEVWEHPTIPEPTSAWLAGLALIALLGKRHV